MKSKYYNQFTKSELAIGYAYMLSELEALPIHHEIRVLFSDAWEDFKQGKFSYDGATFVKERSKSTIFEVCAFIHDWRNSNGYVGKKIDKEMFSIMIALNYSQELIFERYLLTRLTFINVIRHIILGTYKQQLPINIYKL